MSRLSFRYKLNIIFKRTFVVCEKHIGFILFYVSHGQNHIPGIPQSIGTSKPRKESHDSRTLTIILHHSEKYVCNQLFNHLGLWVLVDKSIFVCLQRPHKLPPRRFKCVDETELSYLCFYRSDELLDEVYGCLASTFKPYQRRLLCGNLQCRFSLL